MSRTPSTSRPGSRAGSRENSSTEMRRTKSTSDYGSEIGDAENQDPNFRYIPEHFILTSGSCVLFMKETESSEEGNKETRD